MGKLIGGLLVAAIFYGLYSAGMAGYAYVTIANLLDEVVPRHLGSAPADRFATQDRDERIRTAVAKSVSDADIPITPSAVAVTEDGSRLSVQVHYQYPAVSFQGQTRLVIPVSVSKSFPLPGPRN